MEPKPSPRRPQVAAAACLVLAGMMAGCLGGTEGGDSGGAQQQSCRTDTRYLGPDGFAPEPPTQDAAFDWPTNTGSGIEGVTYGTLRVPVSNHVEGNFTHFGAHIYLRTERGARDPVSPGQFALVHVSGNIGLGSLYYPKEVEGGLTFGGQVISLPFDDSRVEGYVDFTTTFWVVPQVYDLQVVSRPNVMDKAFHEPQVSQLIFYHCAEGQAPPGWTEHWGNSTRSAAIPLM